MVLAVVIRGMIEASARRHLAASRERQPRGAQEGGSAGLATATVAQTGRRRLTTP
jgi:hypothetical protein